MEQSPTSVKPNGTVVHQQKLQHVEFFADSRKRPNRRKSYMGKLVEGEELKRRRRIFRPRHILRMTDLPDGAYAVIFDNERQTHYYHPSNRWRIMNEKRKQQKQMTRFTNARNMILFHPDHAQTYTWEVPIIQIRDKDQVTVVGHRVHSVPLPIWKGTDKLIETIFGLHRRSLSHDNVER